MCGVVRGSERRYARAARPPRVPLARESARLPKAVSLSRAEAALVCAALCFDATDAVSVTGVRKIVHVRFPTRAVCVCEMCYCFLGNGDHCLKKGSRIQRISRCTCKRVIISFL